MKINEFLKNLGIAGHPGLRVDQQLQGYRNFTFGCRAGPGRATINNLAHELGHAVNFGARYFKFRATEYGYDFRCRQVVLLGRFYDEPLTPKATLRELDAFACQAHLMELAGMKFDRMALFKHAAHLMTSYMPDWHCIPGKTDVESREWCVRKAKAFYDRRKPETVKRRLIAWLDATSEHLAEQPLAA